MGGCKDGSHDDADTARQECALTHDARDDKAAIRLTLPIVRPRSSSYQFYLRNSLKLLYLLHLLILATSTITVLTFAQPCYVADVFRTW
jgi:hypothetical protein